MHVRGSIITSFVEMQRRTGQLVDKRACPKVGAKIFSRCRDVTWQKCQHHIFPGNPLSWRKWQGTFIEATCIDFVLLETYFSSLNVALIGETILQEAHLSPGNSRNLCLGYVVTSGSQLFYSILWIGVSNSHISSKQILNCC